MLLLLSPCNKEAICDQLIPAVETAVETTTRCVQLPAEMLLLLLPLLALETQWLT
jgi:hypothetical protein